MDKIIWEQLTSGERDRLVAEQVMGNLPGMCTGVWRESSPDNSCEWDFMCPKCGAVITEEEYEKRDTLHNPLPVPRYTRSMDAAWSVLLKMIERLDLSAGKAKEFRRHEEDALAYLFDDDYGVDNYVVWGEIYPAFTLLDIVRLWTPERICIAALKAVEIQVKG